MNKIRKKIAIITGTESTKTHVLEQLYPLLSGLVDIESYATDSKNMPMLNVDLAIITSPLVKDEAIPFINKNCTVLFARRALDFSSLEKLFSIPEKSEVLLVNDEKETAYEVIELLKESGIDHFNLTPFYPGAIIEKKFEIAITPGESAFAPEGIFQTIDIGPRLIDLTTVVEILQKLDLMDEKAHYVSAKYFETIVRLGKQLYQSNKEYTRANENLNKILNRINDGIIAFTKNGKITVFNQKSEEIFMIPYKSAIGKNISKVIKDPELINYLVDKSSEYDHLYTIGDIKYAITRFFSDRLDAYVVTIKSSEDIAVLETKMRRNLIQRGHIAKYSFNDIIYKSEAMKNTVEIAKKIARTELSTLIYGESGTGKELFASSIHNFSHRAGGPFLAVNFSALPESLVESELFGYEDGAFTGARKGGHIGLFEQANGGTIFLDEIGDTSPKIQARLLRVLQEKEIMKVGGSKIIPVNVRVIAATNKNLVEMCKAGSFREDLYYRLKKLYLATPTLRNRKNDIPELIKYFLQLNNSSQYDLSQNVLNALASYEWPGNVRELENTVEYMLAVCDGCEINIDHLPQDICCSKEASNEPNSIYIELCNKGNIDEYLFILNAIEARQKSGLSIGRKTLSDITSAFHYKLSEEQIRSRTDTLLAMDLISKNRGRGGMNITKKGSNFLFSLVTCSTN